jgi:uncharacterized protein (TIGR02246 family)
MYGEKDRIPSAERAFMSFLGLFILCAGLAIAAPQNHRDSGDKDRAAIAQTVQRFANAWNEHDAHAFALTFTEDADFTNVSGVHAQGRSNVETFHAPLFAAQFKDSHQTAKIRSIRFLRPDLAAVDVDWEMTGAKAADGTPRPDRKGLLNWVMARQADGAWLIQVMHNTDLTDFPAPQR